MIRSICTALAVTVAMTLVACASDTTEPEPETTTAPASDKSETPKVDTNDLEPKIVGCIGPKPTWCQVPVCNCSPINHSCHWVCN